MARSAWCSAILQSQPAYTLGVIAHILVHISLEIGLNYLRARMQMGEQEVTDPEIRNLLFLLTENLVAGYMPNKNKR